MKLFLKYLRQRLPLYSVFILFAAVFGITFLLYRLPIEAVIYPFILCLAAGVALPAIDFIQIKRKHSKLSAVKNMLDITDEALPSSSQIESEDYRKIIQLLREEHIKYRTDTANEYSEMVDYYTVWAHQIKTPLASMRLRLQSEDTAISRQLYGELCRIEQYVEMVLTFLRLNFESTDYLIKEYDLDSIIKSAVKKFSHDFIGKKRGALNNFLQNC